MNQANLREAYYQNEPSAAHMLRLAKWGLVGSGSAGVAIEVLPAIAAAVSKTAFMSLPGIGVAIFVGAYLCSSHSKQSRFTAHTLSAFSGAILAVSFLTHVTALSWLTWGLCNLGVTLVAGSFKASYEKDMMLPPMILDLRRLLTQRERESLINHMKGYLTHDKRFELKDLLDNLLPEDRLMALGTFVIGSFVLRKLPEVYSELDKGVIQTHVDQIREDSDLLPFLPFLGSEKISQVSIRCFLGKGQPIVQLEGLRNSLDVVLMNINLQVAGRSVTDINTNAYVSTMFAKISLFDMAQGVMNSKEIAQFLVDRLELLTLFQQQVVIPLIDVNLLKPAFEKIQLESWPTFLEMMTELQREQLLSGEIPLASKEIDDPSAKKTRLGMEIHLLERMQTYHQNIRGLLEKLQADLAAIDKELEIAAVGETTAVPEEFLDPITNEIMKDPVRLPSGNVCDRSTFIRAGRKDPYTNLPLQKGEVLKDCHELRARIVAWQAEQA